MPHVRGLQRTACDPTCRLLLVNGIAAAELAFESALTRRRSHRSQALAGIMCRLGLTGPLGWVLLVAMIPSASIRDG